MMTFNEAKALVTAIEYNLDGRMKYSFALIKTNNFKLKMHDCVSGKVRYLTFDLKKAPDKFIDVDFICYDFKFNFPLKKNVERMSFTLEDFIKLITYGIKIHEGSLDPSTDLDVEF